MFDKEKAILIAHDLGFNFDKFSIDDFLTGVSIEFEHGYVNPITNITNNNLEKIVKIALAHLSELPNYYNKEYGLLAFEQMLKDKL
ncbi:MAG: DUF5661 family protein [Bacilli bacterium]